MFNYLVIITSRYKLPLLTRSLSAPSPRRPFLSLSLRKAVEEAMGSGLAGITAYVSQDCTGMKDEPAVDKTGDWAWRPSGYFVFHHLFAAESPELRKAVTAVSLCLFPNKHIHSKSITSHSDLFLTSITREPFVISMFARECKISGFADLSCFHMDIN